MARRQGCIFFVNKSKNIHSAHAPKSSKSLNHYTLNTHSEDRWWCCYCFFCFPYVVSNLLASLSVLLHWSVLFLYQLGNIKLFKRTTCALCVCVCVFLFSTASDVGFTSSQMTSPRQMLSQLFCQLQSTCHSGLFAPFIGYSHSNPLALLFFRSQLASERFALCRPHLVFTLSANISLNPGQSQLAGGGVN